MVAGRLPKVCPSLRAVLASALLLLSLVGPVPALAYTASDLGVELDAAGGIQAYGMRLAESADLVGPATTLESRGISTMDADTADVSLRAASQQAATFSLLQATLSTVQFDASAYSVGEIAGSVSITVTLTPTSTDVVTVTYGTTAGTATVDSDFEDASGELVFAPGDEWKLITVPILDDLVDEPDAETVTLTLSSPISATLGTPVTATLSILDDDLPPTAQFSDGTYSVAEGEGTALITITLSMTSENPIQLDYATIQGTATAGADYEESNGTLAFPPGEDTALITVPITDDLLHEAQETLVLVLSEPISVALGAPITATLGILDNDPAPTIAFDAASYSVNEARSPAILTATLSAVSGLTVTVDYTMGSGTGTANQDYIAGAGSLVFAPGEVTQTLSVQIVDDVFDEDDETVGLGLGTPTNATRVTPYTATLTIMDDDDPPVVSFGSSSYTVNEEQGEATITVTLSAPSSRTVTVNYATDDGTATAGSDYTSTAGSLVFLPPATIVVATVENEFATSAYNPPSPDPAGVAYISHIGRLMISDSEVDEMPIYAGANVFVVELGGDLVYTFTTALPAGFSSEPTGVAYNPGNRHVFFCDDNLGRVFEMDPGADGAYGTTDDIISSFRTTHFGSNDAEGVTFDSWQGHLFLSDGEGEEVYQISPGSNGVFDGVYHSTLCASCDDLVTHFDTDRLGVHNPEGVEFDPYTGHLYILGGADDPVAETTIDGELIRYIDISALNATNPGSLAYAPSSADPSQWHLYIVERGIDNNEDPAENDGKGYEISFPPGETTRTFTVPIIDDIVAEGSETVTLSLDTPVNATLDPLGDIATLTIVDGLSSVQFSAASFDVSEDGVTATVTVTLSVPSALTVEVDFATGNGTATAGSDYVAASGTLTFPVGVTERSFGVAITNDALDELDQETVNLTLSSPHNAELGEPSVATLHIADDDVPPQVAFAPPVYVQSEAGVKAIIGVELSDPSALTATVYYTASNGTATAGSDYVSKTGMLTFTPGVVARTFEVAILEDSIDEVDETVDLTLGGPSNATLGTPSATTLTINDNDDPPALQFVSPSFSVAEGAGSVAITVTLSAASGKEVSVGYATSDGTAVAGSDYETATDTLTFAPGETEQTFSITIVGDSLDEWAETVSLALSGESNATLGAPYTATLTILDDDPLPSVQFEGSSYSVGEDGGTATITVTLSVASGRLVEVDYATSDGTATGSDYTTASGTLTFAPGETVQTFSVTVADDDVDESDETVGLALSGAVNADPGTPSTATLTIVDDDDPPTVELDAASYTAGEGDGQASITVTLSHPSAFVVSVGHGTSDGTAVAGSDYETATDTLIFAPGETEQSFSVTLLADALDEWDETVGLALGGPVVSATMGARYTATLTIVDDDDPPAVRFERSSYSVGESAGPATITVTLSAASGKEVSVGYATSDGTAVAGSDYETATGTLSFAPGETEQSFSVVITADSVDEDDETVGLTLEDPVYASLGDPFTASLAIVDDDGPPRVQFSLPSFTVAEPASSATITATLSHLSAFTATVHYATDAGTAAAGSDYATASGTLTFAPGETVQSFSVTIIDDEVDEWDETVILALSAPVSATLGANYTATLAIVDDDDPPTVQFDSTTLFEAEDSTARTVWVTLSEASERVITVDYTTSDGSALAGADYIAASGTLTFTPGSTVRSFTVSILSDELDEGDETLHMTLSNVSNADLGAAGTATLTILDDDPLPSVQFEGSSYSVDEDGGTATITVTLSVASGRFVEVDYATSDGTATGSDYATASGTLTFAPGETVQTFNVTVVDDDVDESDETVGLALSGAVNADPGTPSTATLTIVDDDDPPAVRFDRSSYSVGESSGSATITVTLSAVSSKEVSVEYTTSDGTAVAGSDYQTATGTLTFAPGETQRSFSVTILADSVGEPAETVNLTLSGENNTTPGDPYTATLTIFDETIRLYLPVVLKGN